MTLPAPTNGGEVYLAAILEELQGLRADLRERPGLLDGLKAAPARDVELKELATGLRNASACERTSTGIPEASTQKKRK